MIKKYVFVLAILSGLVLGNSIPLPKPASAQGSDPVFVGAGDIANCGSTKDEATGKLLDGIAGTVFTLGDNVYPDGTLAQFNDCYGPAWGRHKDRTKPATGNHDYHTAGAAGYFSYFGPAASPLDNNCTSDCKGYYSYNLGAWHIIALNSEIDHAVGSVQEKWLRADLAANKNACTLAYWHEPRFSSGQHGNNTGVQSYWQALYDYGADVVLNGHDHTYQRFAPQNPSAQADPKGIREFVVGTGGAGLYSFPTNQPNTEVRNNTTWGVLKLTLHATSYDWQFVPIAGQTFTDSGSANCVGGGGSVPITTNTPKPTATKTSTSAPTATRTSTLVPTATNTPIVPATATGIAVSTATKTAVAPGSTATNTPLVPPTATSISASTATQTPLPISTGTSIPGSTSTSIPIPPVNSSDLIFADDFESGNLSAWSSSATDGGDLSVNAAAALSGKNGLQGVINDNNSIYVVDEHPSAESSYRARFYFDPNSIKMANEDTHFILNGISTTSSTTVLGMQFRQFSGMYQLRARALLDDGS